MQKRCRSQCVWVISSGAVAVVTFSYADVEILGCPFPPPTSTVDSCSRVTSWRSSLVGMRVCLIRVLGFWRSLPVPDGSAASDRSLQRGCVASDTASVS